MGAGASSKGKSPGSTAPNISPPPQIGEIGQNTKNLGAYESQFINEPWSLGNWAMNLATGGTGPQVSQTPGTAGVQTGFFGNPGDSTSGIQTYSGGGAGGGSGSQRNPFGGGPGGPGAPTGSDFNLPGILGGFSSGENAAWNTATNLYPGTAPSDFANAQTGITNAQAGINKDINSVYNRGKWLTPQQEAMINQQTTSNEEQVAQQEGTMGLSGSTQAAQLAGETALAGTATKGQLQQQNMSLVQGWQSLNQGWAKLSQSEQGLALGAQQQAFAQFQNIAQLSATEQGQLFQEGTQGYQLMQTFMSSVLQPYGIGLQAFNDQLQAEVAQVGDQVALQSTAISADQSGQNQVISSAGQVLSSLISDFCWVAREVYGVNNPRWIVFRYWMLHLSPGWFKRFYLKHGRLISVWISNKPLIKLAIKLWMDWISRFG